MSTTETTRDERAESNMPEPERTPREWVFGDIADLIAKRRPLPESIHVFEHGAVSLRLLDNDRAAVDVWAVELQLTTPSLTLPVLVYPDGNRWASYRAEGAHPLWTGWHVNVWCTVDLDVEASAHWDGLLLGQTAVAS